MRAFDASSASEAVGVRSGRAAHVRDRVVVVVIKCALCVVLPFGAHRRAMCWLCSARCARRRDRSRLQRSRSVAMCVRLRCGDSCDACAVALVPTQVLADITSSSSVSLSPRSLQGADEMTCARVRAALIDDMKYVARVDC
jgi:hypothetical protein